MFGGGGGGCEVGGGGCEVVGGGCEVGGARLVSDVGTWEVEVTAFV